MISRVINIREFDLEVKAAVLFGLSALVLSTLIGVISGNGFSAVLLKSFLMTMVFAALGYGIITVVRKFVPELYEVMAAPGAVEGAPGHGDDRASMGGRDAEKVSIMSESKNEGKDDDAAGEEEFVPMKDSDLPKYTYDDSIDKGKMGKHVVVNERKIKHEPKLMAEAIRTMIRRDND